MVAIEISFCSENHNVICMESEKLALSRFMQGLKDPSSRLIGTLKMIAASGQELFATTSRATLWGSNFKIPTVLLFLTSSFMIIGAIGRSIKSFFAKFEAPRVRGSKSK
ncbi:hypothetical protein ACSBR1_000375 [Camellia fascicularis]